MPCGWRIHNCYLNWATQPQCRMSRWIGCPRIAQQINSAFVVQIDKDLVRRVLAKYWPPNDR